VKSWRPGEREADLLRAYQTAHLRYLRTLPGRSSHTEEHDAAKRYLMQAREALAGFWQGEPAKQEV
jgi:hypothetical protein